MNIASNGYPDQDSNEDRQRGGKQKIVHTKRRTSYSRQHNRPTKFNGLYRRRNKRFGL